MFDPIAYMDELGPRPEFKFGIYRNKKRGTYYIVRRLSWNGNNGFDRWEVCYYRVEDYCRAVLHFRTVEQFLEKFEFFEPEKTL